MFSREELRKKKIKCLRKIITENNLPVSKQVGGPKNRTKEMMIDDILNEMEKLKTSPNADSNTNSNSITESGAPTYILDVNGKCFSYIFLLQFIYINNIHIPL